MNYAGFWRRFAAMCIDGLILLIPGILFERLLPYIGGIALGLLYFPIFESSMAQTTPGKYVMGLKVLQENGQNISLWRAFTRYLVKYVSIALFCFGYLLQLFTAKRQTLHDLIAGAIVVRHEFGTSPNWFESWMRQMRYLLRVDDKPAVVFETPSRDSSVDGPIPSNTASTVASHGAHPEVLDAIEKLHSLYRQGALSEDEFQTKKSELLRQV